MQTGSNITFYSQTGEKLYQVRIHLDVDSNSEGAANAILQTAVLKQTKKKTIKYTHLIVTVPGFITDSTSSENTADLIQFQDFIQLIQNSDENSEEERRYLWRSMGLLTKHEAIIAEIQNDYFMGDDTYSKLLEQRYIVNFTTGKFHEFYGTWQPLRSKQIAYSAPTCFIAAAVCNFVVANAVMLTGAHTNWLIISAGSFTVMGAQASCPLLALALLLLAVTVWAATLYYRNYKNTKGSAANHIAGLFHDKAGVYDSHQTDSPLVKTHPSQSFS